MESKRNTLNPEGGAMTTSTNDLTVRFFNLGRTDCLGNVSLDEAIAHGVRQGFEFVVEDSSVGKRLALWSPIGGLLWRIGNIKS